VKGNGYYVLTIAGQIGPLSRHVLSDLLVEHVPRHHVLLIPAVQTELISLLDQLDERGIEVDRVTGWYS
jgi:hypothetical protein